jgi:hypothetical protein
MSTPRELDAALRRLRSATTAIWVVQCNPRRTDPSTIATAFRRDGCCVKRHAHAIRRGDRVVLWLSGPDAGVHALGEVCGAVSSPEPGAGRVALRRVPVDLFLDLSDRPIRRVDLVTDRRVVDESILRQPFAANPHRLSGAAFDALLERVVR